jgi:hypothetical protein
MDKIKNFFIFPTTIITASLILGSFYYVAQVNKQKSIEKQEEAKAEQAKKEYVAKRRNECYDIYLREKKNWANVVDVKYSEVRDICIVKYQSYEPARSKEECDKILKNISELKSNSDILDMLSESYTDCLNNQFSKEF